MKIKIKKLDNLVLRPYIIIREDGDWEQHSHMETYEDCQEVKKHILANKYPDNETYRLAMERLLTKEEWCRLRKKQRYYNANHGVRRK